MNAATVSIAERIAELERELARAEAAGDPLRYRHAERLLEQLLSELPPAA